MAKKIVPAWFLFFLSLLHIYALETDNFNFYTEEINADQLKTIEITVPDLRSKGTMPGLGVYVVKIGSDGIIRSVVLKSTAIPDFTGNSYHSSIFRNGNLINIASSNQVSQINNIKWDNDLYVRGETGPYRLRTGGFTQIKVQQENNVIYESPYIKLLRISSNSLKEINQRGGMALSFSNNTTEASLSDAVEWKIEYRSMPGEIIAVYYDMSMGGADEYPPVTIKFIDNVKLYSQNKIINVINNFILYNAASHLQEVLFPLLFLDNPFSHNNWRYDATSYLVERSTEYSPNNLSQPGGMPWASANGYGIGDKIKISMGNSECNSLMIINGFVATQRPDLFAANSRARQIKISNLSNGRSKIANLADSMSEQRIGIHDLGLSHNMVLEIEVLSVYPGDKYKDLCIQAIYQGPN